MSKPEAITTEAAPAAAGPYSQAIRAGDTLYVSGQIGIDPATGALVEGGIRAETRRTVANVVAIVEAAGGSLASIVRITFFLADWSEFGDLNETCSEIFVHPYPARTTIQNSRPLGARVGADAVAVLG